MSDIIIEEIVVNFSQILENILPSIEFEEDTELVLDTEALNYHGIEHQDGKVLIQKGIYRNDFFNDEFSGFGIKEEIESTAKFHTGIDFSYGKDCPLTCSHPKVFSPITGTIERIDRKNGMIYIKDMGHKKKINKVNRNIFYWHIIKNLDEIDENLYLGTEVFAGKSFLGNMGGLKDENKYWYPQHVHYEIQMKKCDYTGNYEFESDEIFYRDESETWFILNPELFWDYGAESGIDEIYFEEKSLEDEKQEEHEDIKEKELEIDEDGFIILK